LTLAGGSASGAVLQDAVQRLVPEIRVIGNNVTQLYRRDARTAYHLNCLDYGTPFLQTDPASGDEQADTPINFIVAIDFQNNIGCVPQDSYLDATNFSSLDLLITFADPTVMFSAAFDRTATLTGWMYSIVEQTTQPAPKVMRFQDFIAQEITATNPNFETPINIGNEIYQRFVLVTHDAGVRVNTILNSHNVISGEKYFHRQRIPRIVDWDFQWDVHDVDTNFEGVNPIFLTELGRINTGLMTSDVNSCKIITDVTVGAGTTMLYTHTDLLRLV